MNQWPFEYQVQVLEYTGIRPRRMRRLCKQWIFVYGWLFVAKGPLLVPLIIYLYDNHSLITRQHSSVSIHSKRQPLPTNALRYPCPFQNILPFFKPNIHLSTFLPQTEIIHPSNVRSWSITARWLAIIAIGRAKWVWDVDRGGQRHDSERRLKWGSVEWGSS